MLFRGQCTRNSVLRDRSIIANHIITKELLGGSFAALFGDYAQNNKIISASMIVRNNTAKRGGGIINDRFLKWKTRFQNH